MKTKTNIFLIILLCLSIVVVSTSCSSGVDKPSSEGAENNEGDVIVDYPNRIITIVVPYAPGGTHDLLSRLLLPYFEKRGYKMIVQNITSGGGEAGLYEVVNGPNDGYTLVMFSPEVASCQYMTGALEHPFWRELKYLGNFVLDPSIVMVKGDSPYNSLEELFEAAREKPGQLKWNCLGARGKNAFEAYNIFKETNTEFNYVPVDGIPTIKTNLLGGHTDVGMFQLSEGVELHKSGDIKILGVAAKERSVFLQDVPTFAEQGYDLYFGLTRCWAAPPETPQEICDLLTSVVKDVYDDPEAQEAMANMNAAAFWMEPDELKDFGEHWYAIYQEMDARIKKE